MTYLRYATKRVQRISGRNPSYRNVKIQGRQFHASFLCQQDGAGASSSVLDGLQASSRWKKGQLTKIEQKVAKAEAKPQPLDIKTDDEVQQMWKDMESRVTRRKSFTMEEAMTKGRKVGRRNVRKTDEEAWLSAGLYDEEGR